MEFDVAIIGGGIAGSSLAYNIHKINPDLQVLLIERKEIGSQHKSYYVRSELLKAYDAYDLIHNELKAQTKETDSGFFDLNNLSDDPMGCIRYDIFCQHLAQFTEKLIGEVNFYENGHIKVDDQQIRARVIVDCTGHKSFLRKILNLPSPKIGVELIMYDVENVEIKDDGWNTIRLGLGNISNYGFWLEPINQDKSLAYIGTGNWKMLDQPLNQDRLNVMMREYMRYYKKILGSAKINKITYATIAADPVKSVVYAYDQVQFAWLGESAGQNDPYWTIGHGRILPLSEKLANTICRFMHKETMNLQEYQEFWEQDLFKYYKKNWARARILYNMTQDEWYRTLKNRSHLSKELNQEEQIARQSGKKGYGFFHTLKMIGIKQIIRHFYFQFIFTRRLNNQSFWDKKRLKFKPSLLVEKELPKLSHNDKYLELEIDKSFDELALDTIFEIEGKFLDFNTILEISIKYLQTDIFKLECNDYSGLILITGASEIVKYEF